MQEAREHPGARHYGPRRHHTHLAEGRGRRGRRVFARGHGRLSTNYVRVPSTLVVDDGKKKEKNECKEEEKMKEKEK